MNLLLGTAGSQLSHSRSRSGDHKMRDPELTCDLVTNALISECPLEAHLWRRVVKSDAKTQLFSVRIGTSAHWLAISRYHVVVLAAPFFGCQC
jgi:hypothetical protein